MRIKYKNFLTLFLTILFVVFSLSFFTLSILTNISLISPKVIGFSSSSNTPVSFAHNNVASFPEMKSPLVIDKDIKIAMVGDMFFQSPLYEIIKDKGGDPYGNVRDEFSKQDLVIGNFETSLDGKSFGQPQPKAYNLSAPMQVVDLMKNAGIKLVNVANNHAKDYGPSALLKELDILNKSGITPFGAGADDEESFKPTIVTVKGTRIAFLGFDSAEYEINKSDTNTPGTAWFSPYLAESAIRKAKSQADYVIVWAHWGEEHSSEPNDWQLRWGKHFIDYGADIVVGAHPHVRQKYDTYKGKLIFYSLGNFIVQGMGWDPNAVVGSILEITLNDGQLKDFQLKTVDIEYVGTPTIRE